MIGEILWKNGTENKRKTDGIYIVKMWAKEKEQPSGIIKILLSETKNFSWHMLKEDYNKLLKIQKNMFTKIRWWEQCLIWSYLQRACGWCKQVMTGFRISSLRSGLKTVHNIW